MPPAGAAVPLHPPATACCQDDKQVSSSNNTAAAAASAASVQMPVAASRPGEHPAAAAIPATAAIPAPAAAHPTATRGLSLASSELPPALVLHAAARLLKLVADAFSPLRRRVRGLTGGGSQLLNRMTSTPHSSLHTPDRTSALNVVTSGSNDNVSGSVNGHRRQPAVATAPADCWPLHKPVHRPSKGIRAAYL